MIEWAAATARGNATAEAIQSGKEADPSLPAEQRLMNRITKFLITKIDGPAYLSLVQEFAGQDAVAGDTVYMDPTGETEAFSQWLLHDILLPGQTQRAIDLFAEEFSNTLPADEKALLKLRQADRPSLYKVIDLSQHHEAAGVYRVQDLLSSNDGIKIWDVSTSKTLGEGAIFLGRAIPLDDKTDLFSLLGTITEIPDKLWTMLSKHIGKWSQAYFEKNSDATTIGFYRAHHARLRRKILEITASAERHPEGQRAPNAEPIKISPNKKKMASDIHQFVMKARKKGRALEDIMRSPQMMKYMKKFKRLMDTSTQQEMDYLAAKYDGFHDFAKLLENLAAAIQKGDIQVP